MLHHFIARLNQAGLVTPRPKCAFPAVLLITVADVAAAGSLDHPRNAGLITGAGQYPVGFRQHQGRVYRTVRPVCAVPKYTPECFVVAAAYEAGQAIVAPLGDQLGDSR